MDDDTIQQIDRLRGRGASYDAVAARLKEAGHPDPEGALQGYMKVSLPDGRERGQVNPGDPAEHG